MILNNMSEIHQYRFLLLLYLQVLSSITDQEGSESQHYYLYNHHNHHLHYCMILKLIPVLDHMNPHPKHLQYMSAVPGY